MSKHLIQLLIICFVYGCGDCIQRVTGVIVDKQTKKPLDSVDFYTWGKSGEAYSDNGAFEYHGISGGLTSCPDVELYFSRRGYKTQKVTFKSYTLNDTVYLQALK